MPKKTLVNAGEHESHDFLWGNISWFHSAAFSGSEELTFGHVTILPGQENPVHSHPNCEEVLYLLSGKLEHSIENGESMTMEPGSAICIPRGIKHNAKCISDEPAIMVIAFSSAHRQVSGE